MTTLHLTPNGKNRTPEIVEALRTANDDTTLCFENGVYDFYKDGTHEDYFSRPAIRAVTNGSFSRSCANGT